MKITTVRVMKFSAKLRKLRHGCFLSFFVY